MPGKTVAAHTYVTLWQRKHVISGVKTYYLFNRNINCFVSRTMRTVSHQLLNILALGKLSGEGMNHDHVSARRTDYCYTITVAMWRSISLLSKFEKGFTLLVYLWNYEKAEKK